MMFGSNAPFARLVCIGLLFGALASACRRPATTSDPEPTQPSAADLSMKDAAKPEAEVSASSGPVKVTLGVYRTRIKQGQSLWIRITVTNVGKQPIVVPDGYFDLAYKAFGNRYGLGLRLQNPTGGDASAFVGSNMEDHPRLDCMTPEERAPWDALKKEMTSGRRSIGGSNGAWIDPGESVSSRPWAFQSDSERYCRRLPPPRVIAPFSEVPQFQFLDPGIYKLPGRYDAYVEGSDFNDESSVEFDLPPIDVEILP